MSTIRLGRSGKQDVFYNPDKAYNRHITIQGKSGAGKSVAAQMIIYNLVREQTQDHANPEGIKACKVKDGMSSHGNFDITSNQEVADSKGVRNINTVLAFSAHGCLDDKQIFEPIRDEFSLRSNRILVKKDKLSCHLCENLTLSDGQKEDDIDTVMAISNAFTQAFSLGRRQATKLRRAVEKTVIDGSYKTEGIRAIGKNLLRQNNDTAEGVYDLLYSVVGHNVFVDGDLFLEPGRINIVDFYGFNEQSQIATIEMVLSYIWRLALADQLEQMGNLYIFIDEVQNLSLSSKGMLSLLLSEGRKYKLNLILATQVINFSSLNPTQRKLLQAGLILYFKPADCDRSTTAAMISENDKDSWAMELATLNVGEFIATGPLLVGDVETTGPILVDGRIDFTFPQPEDKVCRVNRNRRQVVVLKAKCE